MYLSVVIPLLNEAENIEALYLELSGVLDGINEETEMIFIDDGSVDESVNPFL